MFLREVNVPKRNEAGLQRPTRIALNLTGQELAMTLLKLEIELGLKRLFDDCLRLSCFFTNLSGND